MNIHSKSEEKKARTSTLKRMACSNYLNMYVFIQVIEIQFSAIFISMFLCFLFFMYSIVLSFIEDLQKVLSIRA